MKRISLLLLAFSFLFSMTPTAEARPPRRDSDHGRHEDRRHDGRRDHHDKHDRHHPGHGPHGGHPRHHSKPRFHPILGNYFKSPGYYGKDFYGKRIRHPFLGTIYVR